MNANTRAPAAENSNAQVPWQWQPRDARAATEEERAKYLPLFESDLKSMEHIYARHVEISPEGTLVRSATTTFAVSKDAEKMSLYSMGSDARSAVSSRAQFDATAAAGPKKCAPPKKSCRTCSDLNTAGVLACCGGCAWASGNPVALLSCVIIMCSVCASQNCRRWTYACCDY